MLIDVVLQLGDEKEVCQTSRREAEAGMHTRAQTHPPA